MMQVLVKFHAQVATKMGKSEAILDFEKGLTWSQLVAELEDEFGFEFNQNVFTLVNGKSIWSYKNREEQINREKVIIEVFPALVGG
jgi:molybdopterin converting factor small subunit